MTVLVTGGAGYIGAHVVDALTQVGAPVTVVDDLSTGSPLRIGQSPLLKMDVSAAHAAQKLQRLMEDEGVTSVIHLAARKRVDESIQQPLRYYHENVDGLHNVLSAMCRAGVKNLVFSSSAAVYGEPRGERVSESCATAPINPYGRTKLVGEWMSEDAAATGSVNAVALRYFNVAGATRPELGDPSVMNLITIVIDRLTRGFAPVIYGSDYNTPDGTCVRDFVHVGDLASAHIAAVTALDSGTLTGFEVFNVGTGTGGSVLEVVDRLISLSGLSVSPEIGGRRIGDPESVVADATRIAQCLGWKTKVGLDEILASAWAAREALI